ncbi:unnamed protein product [Effrenium voratum]|nr:unnamed protein product [Effrenium voratum]
MSPTPVLTCFNASGRVSKRLLVRASEPGDLGFIDVREFSAWSCELNAVMLADDKQQLDLHSLIHHSVPSCRSKQAHKNLVGGSAECIFKGTIRVDAEAQQTESSQMVRSLLLSKKSQVKAMPSLQIQADDVSCSHGAALTQLDPDELFYLASRGLDNADARRLMLTGFPTDLLEGLKELAPKAYSRAAASSQT